MLKISEKEEKSKFIGLGDLIEKTEELNVLIEQAIKQEADTTWQFRNALWMARSNHIETMRVFDNARQRD